MSNYPPGVTGFEDAIAGPRDEYDQTATVTHECDEDKFEAPFRGEVTGTVVVWSSPPAQFFYDCPQCGEEVEVTEDDPGWPL